MLAIQGKKVGFDKVIKMIDNMVGLLGQEQLDDDHKKEYCEKQFDFADDKKKALERTVSQLESSIGSAKEGIATLDKQVADATEQRKEENSDYQTLMQQNTAA